MRNVRCNGCGKEFPFSPTASRTSPGTMRESQSAIPPSEVILCPLCRQWTRVQLTDDDGDWGPGGVSSANPLPRPWGRTI
jgi:hypothetical protein